jgi:thiamine-phosphate pyrophosphorylase
MTETRMVQTVKRLQICLPKVYAITDTEISGLSHAEQVAKLSEGGATLVQLRDKRLPPRDFYRQAEEALQEARARNVVLIINDRVDLAMALGADGVHLGQDDLPPEAARRLMGENAIIGFSCHNIEQAAEAVRLPIDYLAIGPVFRTATKINPDAVVGLSTLRTVKKLIEPIPLVAIGGIDDTTAEDCIRAGANAVAVIRFLLNPGSDIAFHARQLLAKLG